MSAELNKMLVQRSFDELHNEGKLEGAEEFISDDFLNHDAPPNAPAGPDGLRAVIQMLRAAFPDLYIEVEEMIAEGDTVVARTTLRGTQHGPFLGIPPTGRNVAVEQVHILRFGAGKVVEHRSVRDRLSMMQQLGVTPDRAPIGAGHHG